MLERVFRLKECGTTAGREIVAGLTTFAAMAYILAVNPDILKNAGMPQAALVTATALSAAIATALMALLTNFPLALAPGMGINAYFAFSICIGMGIPWQSALGLVFINGCLFLLLSVTGIREKILGAIPHSMKIAISAGIGLFIAFIGLENGGLIVANPATLVGMGDLAKPEVALFAGGILLTCLLVAQGMPGAIILSMAVVTAVGSLVPDGKGGTVTTLPPAWVSWPASLEPTFFKLNFDLLLKDHLRALPIILTLLLVDMFDNIGTLIGVTRRAGLMDAQGNIPRVGRRPCRRLHRSNHQFSLGHFDCRQLYRKCGGHPGWRPDGSDGANDSDLFCARPLPDSGNPDDSRGGGRTRVGCSRPGHV